MTRESRSAAMRWAWLSISPTRRRPQSASRPASRGSAWIAARTRSTAKALCPVSAHTVEDQVAAAVVEVDGDLGVEVRGDAVPDVRLDQPLEPVGRARRLVEARRRRRRTAASRRRCRRRGRSAGHAAARSAGTPRRPSRPAPPCRRRWAPARRRWPGARRPTARCRPGRRTGRRSASRYDRDRRARRQPWWRSVAPAPGYTRRVPVSAGALVRAAASSPMAPGPCARSHACASES